MVCWKNFEAQLGLGGSSSMGIVWAKITVWAQYGKDHYRQSPGLTCRQSMGIRQLYIFYSFLHWNPHFAHTVPGAPTVPNYFASKSMVLSWALAIANIKNQAVEQLSTADSDSTMQLFLGKEALSLQFKSSFIFFSEYLKPGTTANWDCLTVK